VSTLHLATAACEAALIDAGIDPKEVDGIATFMLLADSAPTIAVATALGAREARVLLDSSHGGQAPCYLTWLMARLVEIGEIEVGVVYRAMNGRSGARVGAMEFQGDGGSYRYPIGYGGYASYVAMWANRFLHATGQGQDDLWDVARHQSRQAVANPRATRPVELTKDEYLASPFVVEPFRKWDCTAEVDGGCAIVVTSLERARDLRPPPAVIRSGAYSARSGSGLDIGDHLSWPDYSSNYTSILRDRLFGDAGVVPADIAVAEIYDCFTSTVLMGLEGLGLCERGGGGDLVRHLDGLALNTHGGLLYEGYLHGMNTVAEAVLQVQGRAGKVQSDRHDLAVVTSGALTDGSALIIGRDDL
jgi:acetyl-CoA acetyltransferase